MQENRKKSNRIQVKKIIYFFVLLFVALSIFGSGYLIGEKKIVFPDDLANVNQGKPTDVNFALFWEAWNKMKEKSVQDVDSTKMVDGAISGMLASTGDPYTVYFTKKENERFREDIGGEFSGIGVEITAKDNLPTVVAPLPDCPAEKAGVKAGDIITEVDGAKTSEIGFEETINRIRGQEGSDVKLTIAREALDGPLEITIKRAKITVKSVEWEKKTEAGKKIYYIKIRQFGDDSEALFSQAANEIVAEKPDGIVIDLRNDPGGYLDTAVNIASYFIKDGVIVSEKGKNNNNKDYLSTHNGKLKDYPVAVLVNQGSASASEILAGALSDRKGSKLIGEKTFGKGSVQELIDLSDGSAVKITVAKWFTPNGNQINGKGLEPGISVVNDEKTPEDEQLDRALSYIVTGK